MLFNVVSWKKFKQKDGWQSKSEVKVDYDTILSTGFSIEEDSDKVTLATHVNGDLVNGVYSISKSDILSRTVITPSELKSFKEWLSEKEDEDTVTVTVEPVEYPVQDKVSTLKLLETIPVGLTMTEQLAYEKDNLSEVPTVFHGVNVKEFIQKYNELSNKKLAEYFNTSSQIVYTLNSILKRLGAVSSKTNVPTVKVEVKKDTVLGKTKKIQKNSFKAKINLSEFKKDVKSLGIKELCAKYGVSDYTIYDAIHYYDLNDYEKGKRRVLEPVEKEISKVDMLIARKAEIAKLAPTSTQGYLAKKFGVSQYTMNTVLKKLGIQSAGSR